MASIASRLLVLASSHDRVAFVLMNLVSLTSVIVYKYQCHYYEVVVMTSYNYFMALLFLV